MKCKWKITALLCLLISAFASAEITLNGFASIRATVADSDNGTSPFPTFKGNDDVSFKDESLFAVQARADLSEGLSATVQFMAEGTNDFDVEARWAYLSYELNDTHQVNAGRFANPIFFQSQYEKVGYAHNFARLPKAVYIGFDFSTIEGISLDSSFYIDDYTLETKLLYGNWNGTTFLAATSTTESFGLQDIISLNATLSGDWWKIYAGGFATKLEGGTLDSLFLTFAQPGISAALANGASQSDVDALTNAIKSDGKDGEYWFAGFNIDYNNFIVDFEYADYVIADSADAPNDVWYAALGYRFDDFVFTVHTEDYGHETDFSTFNKVSDPILKGTGQAIQSLLGQRKFDGSGLTLRYDFHPSAALKVDYFSGEDTRPTVGDYSILSAGVDVVF